MDIKSTLMGIVNMAGIYPNGKPLPKSWGDDLRTNAAFTPDVLSVNDKTRILLFNPDPGVQVEGIEAFTTSTFNVYQTQDRVILIPKYKGDKEAPGWGKAPTLHPSVVRGRLGWVPPSQVLQLDNRYENGVECERTTTWLTVPFTLDKNRGVYCFQAKATIYVGKTKYWHKKLDGGYTTKELPALPSGLRVVQNHVIDPRLVDRKRR